MFIQAIRRYALPTAFLMLLALPARAAEDRPVSDFYGEYVGKSIAGSVGAGAQNGEIAPRHINVSIQPHDQGFTVAWLTVISKASGKTKAKSFIVDFMRADMDGVYKAGMRRDAAGNLEPLDPMSGDPYVWANVSGDTLTVNALLVTDDGGWEVQVYERTLVEGGMDLSFRSYRDGVQMKEIQGELTRVSD